MEDIINRIVKEVIDKFVANQQILTEYGQVNRKDGGNTLFPNNKYKICIYLREHEPPHFHIETSDGWNVSFLISNGAPYQIHSRGKKKSDYRYMCLYIREWLKTKSTLQDYKNLTNKAVLKLLWKKYQQGNSVEKSQ